MKDLSTASLVYSCLWKWVSRLTNLLSLKAISSLKHFLVSFQSFSSNLKTALHPERSFPTLEEPPATPARSSSRASSNSDQLLHTRNFTVAPSPLLSLASFHNLLFPPLFRLFAPWLVCGRPRETRAGCGPRPPGPKRGGAQTLSSQGRSPHDPLARVPAYLRAPTRAHLRICLQARTHRNTHFIHILWHALGLRHYRGVGGKLYVHSSVTAAAVYPDIISEVMSFAEPVSHGK